MTSSLADQKHEKTKKNSEDFIYHLTRLDQGMLVYSFTMYKYKTQSKQHTHRNKPVLFRCKNLGDHCSYVGLNF